jgi:hypothetical protein
VVAKTLPAAKLGVAGGGVQGQGEARGYGIWELGRAALNRHGRRGVPGAHAQERHRSGLGLRPKVGLRWAPCRPGGLERVGWVAGLRPVEQ